MLNLAGGQKKYNHIGVISLQPGTPWEETKRDLDEESDTESTNEACGRTVRIQEEPAWTDWTEVNTHPTTCLFCPFTTTKVTVPNFQPLFKVAGRLGEF